MKKLVCILAVMLMLCLCTIAYAAAPVTLDITALDYQTGNGGSGYQGIVYMRIPVIQ